jgi:hypothetical protein
MKVYRLLNEKRYDNRRTFTYEKDKMEEINGIVRLRQQQYI